MAQRDNRQMVDLLSSHFRRRNEHLGDLPGGRLTLTSDTPVPTSDVTGATILYYTPYVSDTVPLYDGENWGRRIFSELSLDISGYTASKNYDIFIYDNAGTLTLSGTVWTNNTTRATAITRQDGRYVKSGATGYLYLGTIRINSSGGQCDDAARQRFVWNNYSRLARTLNLDCPGTSHFYSTATYRQLNNNSANQVEFVIGVAENNVHVQGSIDGIQDNGEGLSVGIGYDSTAVNSNLGANRMYHTGGVTMYTYVAMSLSLIPSIGFHYLALLEYVAAGNVAVYDQFSYIVGTHYC
jgi:hypothetical protein